MRRYSNQLWVEQQADSFVIGMTKSLQCDAGDISYAQIAPLGEITPDATLVNLEASKAAIEVPCPLNGTVIARNEAAEATPSLLDSTDAACCWLVKLTNVSLAEFEALATEE